MSVPIEGPRETGRSEEGPRRAAAAAPAAEGELVRQALVGERGAWEALIARYNRRVVVSLLARGVRVDRAQELAQETWARLIQQQQRGLLTDLRLPSLALTQAAFLAADDARHARRELVSEEVQALIEQQQPIDPLACAERRLLSQEQLARVQEALAECSPSARTVFLLAYDGQESPHSEIASRVGLSVQRVRQVLCEVRKKLRDSLEEKSHA